MPILSLLLSLLAPSLLFAQGRDWVRAHYTKFEYEIPMRDGLRLFTALYVPKDASAPRPILLIRTPYGVGPYGVDHYRENLGPSEAFAKSLYIFAYQDVRGRYMSEGKFVEMRPHSPRKAAKDFDESSDTYDAIEWLVKNVPGNNGRVGMWGISYPGFYVSAGMIDAHPTLKAASPQAPVTDYYLGDDSYHNGAFFLAANFGFYSSFVDRKGAPAPPDPNRERWDRQNPDGYRFYLEMGSHARGNERFPAGKNDFYTRQLEHPNYDDYWKARSIWRHFEKIKPAVLTVGGWFDAEDLQGPLRTYETIEKSSPGIYNGIVMGPWTHGSWAGGTGDRVGNLNFASKTAEHYREKIEFPFFEHFLKGKGDGKFADAYMFETGTNRWREFSAWPPATAKPRAIYLRENGRLSWDPPAAAAGAFDEYLSDPNKPVPYVGFVSYGMNGDYMTEDQRFAATRPDVLVYETEPLAQDLTVAGPLPVSLHVSTTGTDSDFVVKLIDVYPNDFPGDLNGRTPAGPRPANAVRMGGYQQLVRGEPFRGRFRRSFEKPEPFVPGQADKIEFTMPAICHTFRKGHRIMVQVQSSWFPLTDRNPQAFVNIPTARPEDFRKATQRVYRAPGRASAIQLPVLP